jgi:hypothetical protein
MAVKIRPISNALPADTLNPNQGRIAIFAQKLIANPTTIFAQASIKDPSFVCAIFLTLAAIRAQRAPRRYRDG